MRSSFIERDAHGRVGVSASAASRARPLGDQHAHAERVLRGLRHGAPERAVTHDAENLAGELADRRARHGELFGARPGAVDGGLAVFAKAVREQQDRAEHVLRHGRGAVVADIAHRDAEFARGLEIDVVGAGGGEADELSPGTARMRARVMFSLLVRMNSTAGDALVHLGFGRCGEQRDAGQHTLEAGGVEVIVTDRAEIQEYRSHPVP